jgi:outer membrane protein OmpA-like peptidoglycan-associated protein
LAERNDQPHAPLRRRAAGAALGLAGLLTALPCLALPLEFAAPVRDVARVSETMASYAMPVGPFAGGALPVRDAEGAFEQESYQLEAGDLTTLELLAPLRDQLTAQGYRTVFECESFGCGGYDFRFGTRVMPEPDMHVDLGDFRYLAAARGDEVLSLIVSRSSMAGFVQVTRVFPPRETPPGVAMSSKSPEDTVPAETPPDPLDRIAAGERVVLDGLEFASGAAVLAGGSDAALAGLAAWLDANPQVVVDLLGYTDASGPMEANITLSRARAEAVKNALVAGYGIDPSRLRADGMGPESPLADNATPEGRRINRRVEVSLTSTPITP